MFITKNNIKKILRNSLIILGIFLISFFAIHVLGFSNTYGDPINSYGFAKAISMGQVPYRDFNMIVTPLYAVYQSLFLHIFDDFIMIEFSQALIITLDVILLYKLYGKKCLLLLLIVAFFMYRNLIPTYNSLVLFFIILLVFMEKKYPDKDYLIGIILGLSVMTKQTIGCFLVIPTFILYYKEIKKILKRFCGFLIPCFVFLFYLLLNGALYNFFDLALFGIFDFASNNGVGGGHIIWSWIIVAIITLVIAVVFILRHKNDKSLYYLICGSLFMVPICNVVYVAFWLTCFMMMFLPYIKKREKELVILGTVISSLYMILCFVFFTLNLDLSVMSNIKHFKYTLHSKDSYENLIISNEYVNSFDNPIVIGYYSMFHTISNDKKFSYFNLLYDGNYGHKGSKSMIDKIENMSDQIFIVSMVDYNNDNGFSQFSKDIAKHIMDNYKLIDEKYVFKVYYKE